MSDTAIEMSGRSLVELEAIVERGLSTFVEVGSALLAIRSGRKYSETHPTWEDYCRDRWGFNRQRASQLIQAAEVSKILDTAPANDAQARELAPLKDDPEAMREVWGGVSAETNGRPTAKAIKEAVDRRLGMVPPTERQAVVLQAIEDASPLLDEPERERALYALSRAMFWVYLNPADVAEAAAEPAQDAAGYVELAAWVRAIADRIQARAQGLRIVEG